MLKIKKTFLSGVRYDESLISCLELHCKFVVWNSHQHKPSPDMNLA